ncbi:MAG: adenylyl-sulfate kinase [Verrucomicrobiae bacterium]|nr:adenylyl-sulfate kinase [Verrucomicrobiae bacterium]
MKIIHGDQIKHLEWNPSGQPTEQLKIVIVGHVDHGKSTFIGRLFYDTGSLPDGKYEQLVEVAKRRGVPFEWANLMDGLQAERDQNITIDTAQIWFRTQKRQYVIIDAPGHKEFLKNMITGAANAEAALLLIAANEGVQEQSRRHGYLLNLLGIRQVAVLVNKMDMVDHSDKVFKKIEDEYRAFLTELGVQPKVFIPIAAKNGDNIASLSTNMPWYRGMTVMQILDEFNMSELPKDQPLRLPLQDVYRFDDRRILAGRIESGSLKVGDKLIFSPRNKTSVVKTIERWNAPSTHAASAGESIGITLTEQIFVERGQVASHEDHAPIETDVFNAKLFWLGRQNLELNKPYKLKLTTQEVECRIQSIQKIIDASTLQEVNKGRNFIARNDVAELTIRSRVPIAIDNYDRITATGRFVLVDRNEVSGGGIIHNLEYPDRRSQLSGIKSQNITWVQGKVTRTDRERRNNHKGAVIWLTGLSGSGKSTVGLELERELFNMGVHTFYLDGDNVRHGLSSNLGFSPEDRAENIRRVGEMAKLFAEAGTMVITAFISPYRDDRRTVRSILPAGEFIEVFVDAPVEVCEQRDPKGLYKKARAGQIKEFTGISAPYEAPEQPEIHLRTDKFSVAESVTEILEYLKQSHIGIDYSI